jgi:hypothetical protein
MHRGGEPMRWLEAVEAVQAVDAVEAVEVETR